MCVCVCVCVRLSHGYLREGACGHGWGGRRAESERGDEQIERVRARVSERGGERRASERGRKGKGGAESEKQSRQKYIERQNRLLSVCRVS
jgi:hypothetical protein